MKIVKLADSVAVAGQITPEDVATVAAAGYRVLINNRPDGEEGNQPTSADIATAAAVAGLEYHHLPLTAGNFPGPGFEQMGRLLDDSSRPVLAFCRTGTRCTNLWVASQSESCRGRAVTVARQLGYELGMAASFTTRS